MEELEKVSKITFPLKSEVDIRSLCEVARRQLKMKINTTEITLDKLFPEVTFTLLLNVKMFIKRLSTKNSLTLMTVGK